jgi:hypothetical protein
MDARDSGTVRLFAPLAAQRALQRDASALPSDQLAGLRCGGSPVECRQACYPDA